jgi:hypothetical protein
MQQLQHPSNLMQQMQHQTLQRWNKKNFCLRLSDEITRGTRSGTESLPKVFFVTLEQFHYYFYYFCPSHKEEMRRGTKFYQKNVFLPESGGSLAMEERGCLNVRVPRDDSSRGDGRSGHPRWG